MKWWQNMNMIYCKKNNAADTFFSLTLSPCIKSVKGAKKKKRERWRRNENKTFKENILRFTLSSLRSFPRYFSQHNARKSGVSICKHTEIFTDGLGNPVCAWRGIWRRTPGKYWSLGIFLRRRSMAKCQPDRETASPSSYWPGGSPGKIPRSYATKSP